MFLDCPILPVDGGKNCVTRSEETWPVWKKWEEQRHQRGTKSGSCTRDAGERGILDGTRHDSSEDAKQSWHDEGGRNSFASVVNDGNASRRQASTISSRVVRKHGVCDWSDKAWDLTMAYFMTGLSIQPTSVSRRRSCQVPRLSTFPGVSGGMFVSIVSAVQADPSQPTGNHCPQQM